VLQANDIGDFYVAISLIQKWYLLSPRCDSGNYLSVMVSLTSARDLANVNAVKVQRSPVPFAAGADFSPQQIR
jgi:hypothetical protein